MVVAGFWSRLPAHAGARRARKGRTRGRSQNPQGRARRAAAAPPPHLALSAHSSSSPPARPRARAAPRSLSSSQCSLCSSWPTSQRRCTTMTQLGRRHRRAAARVWVAAAFVQRQRPGAPRHLVCAARVTTRAHAPARARAADGAPPRGAGRAGAGVPAGYHDGGPSRGRGQADGDLQEGVLQQAREGGWAGVGQHTGAPACARTPSRLAPSLRGLAPASFTPLPHTHAPRPDPHTPAPTPHSPWNWMDVASCVIIACLFLLHITRLNHQARRPRRAERGVPRRRALPPRSAALTPPCPGPRAAQLACVQCTHPPTPTPPAAPGLHRPRCPGGPPAVPARALLLHGL